MNNPNSMKNNIFTELLSYMEFAFILLKGKLWGISLVVKYLRNPNPRITVKLLKSFGARIGKGSTVKRSVFIDNSFEDMNSTGDFSNIIIGRNCYIGDCVYFDLSNQIIIEDNCVISGKVSFLTHADCNRSEYLNGIFPRKSISIRIGTGAWIGFNSCLLPGVTVGENSVLAAYSLLRSSTENKTLNAGVPSLKIREI